MSRDSISLMAIDHADWLFKPLCKIEKIISYEEYENILVKVSKNKIGKGKRTVEMHLYWLTTLNFLKAHKNAETTYEITPKGKTFCQLYNNPKMKTNYKNYLKSNLYRNKRLKPFFQKFEKLIEQGVKERNPRKIDDLVSKFPGEPATARGTLRALYTMTKEADIITDKNGRLGLKAKKVPKINLKKFKKELVDTYQSLQNQRQRWTEPRKIYIEIGVLRDILLSVLGITENRFFDKFLKELLNDPIGKDIHVYGSAPQWFTKQKKENIEQLTFRHKGKIHVYLSIS